MKRILVLILLLLAFTAPACAKPSVDEFRREGLDIARLGTVLVMPVKYAVSAPASEAFFDEAVSQKWREITAQTKLPFLVKTPREIVERHNFVKGTASADLSAQQTEAEAASLAGQYVEAVLTATVTKCGVSTVHHPEEVTWDTRYEKRSVWVRDHWEDHEFPVPYQRVNPAWDETSTVGAVKLELRDPRTPDNTLLYGVSAAAEAGDGFFSSAPTVTKHICNLLEYAVKTMAKKK